jgi:hypothetical protein
MENDSGPGFYKNDNGELLHGPNFVYGPSFTLTKDDTSQEADGWKWFETEEAARLEYNLPVEEPEPDPDPET